MEPSYQPEQTVAALCDMLGRKEIARALGRTVAAVSNAASDGAFPAGWYVIIERLCLANGIQCPVSLFRFIQPSSSAGHCADHGRSVGDGIMPTSDAHEGAQAATVNAGNAA